MDQERLTRKHSPPPPAARTAGTPARRSTLSAAGFVAALALTLAPSAAQAVELPQLAACLSTAVLVQRLACYDGFGRAPLPVQATAPRLAPVVRGIGATVMMNPGVKAERVEIP